MEALIGFIYVYWVIAVIWFFVGIANGVHALDSIVMATAWPLFWIKAIWKLLKD